MQINRGVSTKIYIYGKTKVTTPCLMLQWEALMGLRSVSSSDDTILVSRFNDFARDFL